MDPRAAKEHLRQSIKERLARMSEKERHAESRTLCRELLKLLPKDPGTLCGYFPLQNEADIRPLLLEVLKNGWQLFLPVFAQKKLTFRQALNLSDLPAGELKIPEPPPDAPELDPKSLTLALIPARAYDRALHRLGRGNGGYDIWIREQRILNPATQFWGVALEAQIVDEVPVEEHDEKVDQVVTARGVLE